jgi:hypothetical protein
MRKWQSLLFTAALLGALSARADTPPPTEPPAADWQTALKSVTEACKGDMPQLCPGLSVDTAMACLHTNIDKVTPACKDAVMKLAKTRLTF